MALYHGAALPVTDEAPVIDLIRAVLDPDSVRDLAQPGALGLCTVLTATFGLTEMPSEITTPCLAIPDQGVDPLMTDTNGGHHARQVLRPLGGGVAAKLTADRAAVEAQLSADLALAYAQVITGVDLVSLGLGQLSVSHALLHFGR
nr:hypothetical protein [Halomonas borealis]